MTKQIRRVCLYGGPGAGKSTAAAFLFSELKRQHLRVELVTEYVKKWAYLGQQPQGLDQVYLFSKQMYNEMVPLDNGADVVITDSPLFLSCCYGKLYSNNEDMVKALLLLNSVVDAAYPPLNIVIYRGDKRYVEQGRYQNEQQARDIDRFVNDELADVYGTDNIHTFPFKDRFDDMLSFVSSNVQYHEPKQ